LSSLAAHPEVPLEIDTESLTRYLLFESFHGPDTPLKGVHKLLPGHRMILDLDSWELNIARYWSNQVRAPAEPEKDGKYLERFQGCFEDAVSRHLRSDVEVGVFLSGGLDSPSLVKAATAVRGRGNFSTFTIRHEIESFNEADEAREVARFYGTRHHERTLTRKDLLSEVPGVLSRMDEPIADPGFIAISQVTRYSREFVKTILSGNGGDEFFAGYAPFRALMARRLFCACVPLGAACWLARITGLPPAGHDYMNPLFRMERFLRGATAHPAEVLMRWIGAFDDTEIGRIVHPDLRGAVVRGEGEEFSRVFHRLYESYREFGAGDDVSLLSHEFQGFFLTNCICNHADKASMMVSQELRSPFLDAEVMRLANRLPSRMKYRAGQTKYIMRRYLADGPPGVSRRPKRGFTVPVASWLAGPLKQWAEEILDPAEIREVGLFNAEEVSRLWNEHQAGRRNHAKKLWTLIVFQIWFTRQLASWKRVRQASPCAV